MNDIQYKEVNGTFYRQETSDEIVDILEQLRHDGTRVRFHWGDSQSGEDWGDIYDVTGRIGRSTGPRKIPLLIKTRRSSCGDSILDHCIVRIRHANKKNGGDIYVHPSYHA